MNHGGTVARLAGLGGFLVAIGYAAATRAAAGDPIEVRMSNCKAFLDGHAERGYFGQRYEGFGYGNPDGTRGLTVFLAYHTVDPSDDIADAIAETNRIELCYRETPTGTTVCPGTHPWLIFDRNANVGSIDPAKVGAGEADARTHSPARTDRLYPFCVEGDSDDCPDELIVPVDWKFDADTTLVFPVVNRIGDGSTPADEAAVQHNGYCGNFRLLSDDPGDNRFLVFGRTNAIPESCNGGRIDDILGRRRTGDTPCVTDDQADWVRQVLLSFDEGQRLRVQATLINTDPTSSSDLADSSPSRRILAWANGRSVLGTVQPLFVFLHPADPAGGVTGNGGLHLFDPGYRGVVPGQPPGGAMPRGACGILDVAAHEYFHSLQTAWIRERPKSDPHVALFTEAHATLAGMQMCPVDFPDAPTTEQCVSARRYGPCDQSAQTLGMFRFPDRTTVNIPYEGLFWNYVGEQFAYPVTTPPNPQHPGGESSTIERAENADTLALAARPFSDEGMDIIGHLFEAFAGAESGVSTYDVTSTTFERVLGRSFADVVFDFHTALYLKDYTEKDARFRFQWTHRDGFRSRTRLIDGKPFEVPSDLNSATCDVAGTGTICDGLLRAHRARDSWIRSCTPGLRGACTGTAVRDLMGVDDTIRSTAPVELEPWGTTAVSVSLEQPAWLNAGPPGGLAVRAEVLDGSPVRFRIFEVVGDGTTGQLVPNGGQERRLRTTPSSGAEVLNESLPVGNALEVVLIASAGDGPSKFTWQFGQARPELRILSPQTHKPAFVGQPSRQRRSFLIQVAAHDVFGDPFAAGRDNLHVFIDGCFLGAGCELPRENYSLLPPSGGNHLIVATLPTSFYPSDPNASGNFDLRVAIDGVGEATAPDALRFSPRSRTQATVFVLDKSFSMLLFNKAESLRIVARGLVESMMPVTTTDPPTHQLAIVSFNQDADTSLEFTAVARSTRSEIDDAIASVGPNPLLPGSTSIGDGVLEAQSVLATEFDGAMDVPDDLAMIVLSDGLHNADAHPSLYYDIGTVPMNDGRGEPWYSGLLKWQDRVREGLRVPEISAITLGQDASNVEMDRLARLSGGEVIALPGSDSSSELRSQALRMADLFTSSYDQVSDYDRVLAAVLVGGGIPEPPDPRVTTTAVAGVVTIPVEPDAQELRVTVMSAFPGHAAGELRDGAGIAYPPTGTSSNGDSATFRISSPSPGFWTFRSFAPAASGESVFVEATVRSPVELFTSVDVADTPRAPAELTPPQRTDVFIRAVPWEAGPMLDCSASAAVTNPGSAVAYSLALLDDGKHHDGEADDGVYGALVSRTSAPGAHDVSVHVECVSARSGALIVREGRGSFVIAHSLDGDGDGMADPWEDNVGLDRTVNDCLGDPDADGLSNCAEFTFGTHPRLPDTDFGGESDYSEFFGGRHGRDPSDDIGSKPHIRVDPGNGKACVSLDMSTDGLTVAVERGSSAAGPFTPVATFAPGASSWCDRGRPNDADVCYRVRVQTGAASSLSDPVCTRPNTDPYPPRLVPGSNPTRSCTRDVTIEFRVEDTKPGTHTRSAPEELGVVDSPVEEMRWWFGTDPAPPSAPWEPLRTSFSVRAPDLPVATISIQVRDRAGNESEPLTIIIRGCRGTSIGRAIAAEERAEDLLARGDARGARAAVAASIEEIERALRVLFREVGHRRHPPREIVELGKNLYRILALKIRVKALLDERDCDHRNGHGWGRHDSSFGRWDHRDRGHPRSCPPSRRELDEARRLLTLALELEAEAFELSESSGTDLK